MLDMKKYVVPKSDQLNADDLIGGTMTINITNVKGVDDAQQPIVINYEGDNGRPYKPCKSMRRVLIMVWGDNGNSYVGKSMTLFRDPDVVFGGIKTGGIRISHMSDIDKPVTVALTANKVQRKPYTVKPLAIEEKKKKQIKIAENACIVADTLDENLSIDELIIETGTDLQNFLQYFNAAEINDLTEDQKQKAIELLKKKGKK